MTKRILALIMVSTLLAGCASHRAERGHVDMRATALQMHETQIIENLALIKLERAPLHHDYTALNAEVTDKGTGGGKFTHTEVTNSIRDRLATAETLKAVTTDLVEPTVSAEATTQLTITAKPVNAATSVYGAYGTYLGLDPDTGSLGAADRILCSNTDPGCNAVAKHRFLGRWWYVPMAYQNEFRSLTLLLVSDRAGAKGDGGAKIIEDLADTLRFLDD